MKASHQNLLLCRRSYVLALKGWAFAALFWLLVCFRALHMKLRPSSLSGKHFPAELSPQPGCRVHRISASLSSISLYYEVFFLLLRNWNPGSTWSFQAVHLARGSWSPNVCLLTMPAREVISIEWTRWVQSRAQSACPGYCSHRGSFKHSALGTDSVSSLWKAFCVFPWVLTSPSTVHPNPGWASLISKYEPQCFQIRSVFSAHSKPQAEWTTHDLMWLHTTSRDRSQPQVKHPKDSAYHFFLTGCIWMTLESLFYIWIPT